MAGYTSYYPIVGGVSVKTHDGPFYYEPTGIEGGSYSYVRGPWDKKYGMYSYGTWWKLYPHQMSDASPNTQTQTYTLPATPTPFRWHLASHISPRLKAQTLGGTFDLIMAVRQSHADCQFGWRVVVWVSKGPYFLPERGLALDYTEPAGRPWPLVSTGWGLPSPQALAPIAIQDGDYLTVEVGVVAYAAPGASRSADILYAPVSGRPPTGVPYPPLTVGSTLTTTQAGRVLFSQPLVLLDPPANDSCATPIVITTLPWADATPVNAELATYDPTTDLPTGPPASNSVDEGLYNTVWWLWTAPSTGTLRLEADRVGGDSNLVVYTGSCGALTKVAAAVGYNGSVPLIKLSAIAGTTYHFRLSGRSHLSATRPRLVAYWVVPVGNDHFANRTVITALPYTEVGELTLATMEAGEPNSPTDWTSNPVQSVWYEWTADATPGHIRVDTTGSGTPVSEFDSQVTVWTRAPLSTFPVPPATDLYDSFNLPDRATLFNPWLASLSWGGASLGILNQSAVSARVAPLSAGNYWGRSYGPDCEFWGLLRGDFPSTGDWIGIDAFTNSNPSSAARNGFWVGARRDGTGYHALLGRYDVGLSTTLTTSTSAVAITGIGFRRLGTTLYLWVQRAGVWAVEFTTTDANHAGELRPTIGVMTAAPGNVAFETFGGSALRPWLGDLWIEVFSAPWTNTAVEEGYSDQANMVFRPTPGVTYYITIFSRGGGYWNNYGASTLLLTISRVTPPPNETCATARPITVPAYLTIDITNAADGQMELVPLDNDSDVYTMEQNDSGKVLWYKWTADRTAEMNYNSFGSGWYGPSQEVVLYRGTCGALELLQSNSYNMRYEATQLFFTAEIGTTYYWRVTSNGRISGPVYFYLDVDHTTWQTGDIILSDDYLWIFAPSGAARRVAGVSHAIPTGSGIDPVSGLLYVASWYGNYVMQFTPRLVELSGGFSPLPGKTPEIPGFFQNGQFYVGHWGNYSANQGIDGLVDPSHAIRGFTAATGVVTSVHLAKQENTGTAWIDPAADQQTIRYTSRGRKIMAYDILADVQLPDVVTLTDPYPAYRARAIRHRPNNEILLGDATEVKRLSPTGAVLQRYPVLTHDDLFVIDQDPDSLSFWVGDQDTSLFYRIDIATGAILLAVPGGHFGAPYMGPGYLCGLTVVGGYRAGVSESPEPECVNGAFPIEGGVPAPIEPPVPPRIPVGTIMVGGWGDSPAFAFLSPSGTTSYAPPPAIPTFSSLVAFCRTTAGHIGVLGAYADPFFGDTNSGLLKASDLSVLAEKTTGLAAQGGIAADGLGFWYVMMLDFPVQETAQIRRVNAASVEVAAWNIPIPVRFKGAYIWALAVNEAGTLAYAWMEPDFFTQPDYDHFYLHTFSLVGSGAYLGLFTPTYFANHPTYNSLFVVPDGTGDLIMTAADAVTRAGILRRYTPSGTVVWNAGTPAGAGDLWWGTIAAGVPGDTHFLAVAYDGAVETSSGVRYCWFSYATGLPDNTRNFVPDDGAGFEFDSQIIVLAVPIP